ncbi:hypothetical protein FGM00_11290 [Aggregatimonas sangjinii]|uniref:Uncharacterized protein n=1 Tax=Aggregatimonas sangjinii TaxID=2583587 RepID=A0A5B7SUS9_9FLAO|nr:hypothetical protein [Aggregatimonas sangjinii]QCX00661.1 hypothetical protein FGM00_11290 [Aggregatimonas sangjinii]
MQQLFDNLLGRVFGVGTGSGNGYEFVDALRTYSLQFAAVLMILYIGYKALLYFSDIETRLDPFILIRPIMVMCIISLYSPLVNLLVKQPIDIIDAMVETSSQTALESDHNPTGDLKDVTDTYADWYKNAFEDTMQYVDDGSSSKPGKGVFDILAINPFLELVHLIIFLVATVVGFYIMARQIILIGIYYVVGILVLPFALIVGNQDVARNWYFGFIAIMMWEPVLKILKTILISLKVQGESYENGMFSIALQVVMIFTILQVPKFANLLVSKGSEMGSQVGGTVMSTVSGAAGSMMKRGKK